VCPISKQGGKENPHEQAEDEWYFFGLGGRAKTPQNRTFTIAATDSRSFVLLQNQLKENIE